MTEDQERTEALGDQLRAKIAGKFQTATFLAGFGLAVLSIQISTLWQSERLPAALPLSIAMMAAAVVCYVAALIHLDALTMPKRFWGSAPGDTPPDLQTQMKAYLRDRDLVGLKNHMLFYWYAFGGAATLLALLSLLIMLLPLRHGAFSDELVEQTLYYSVAAVVCALVYVAAMSFLARRVIKPLIWTTD